MSGPANDPTLPGDLYPRIVKHVPPFGTHHNKRNFYYAYTKAAVEQIMEDFARSHPDIVVTRFRSSILVGPRILEDSYQLRLLSGLAGPSRSFWGFRPVGANRRLAQYTHEGDLSEAVLHALHHEMRGAYNIAGEPLDLESYLRNKGKTFRPIPWAPAYALAWLLSPFSSRMRRARAWLVSARYRNILDCSKLRRSGFDKTLRTTFECLEDVSAFLAESRAADAKGPQRPGADR